MKKIAVKENQALLKIIDVDGEKIREVLKMPRKPKKITSTAANGHTSIPSLKVVGVNMTLFELPGRIHAYI